MSQMRNFFAEAPAIIKEVVKEKLTKEELQLQHAYIYADNLKISSEGANQKAIELYEFFEKGQGQYDKKSFSYTLIIKICEKLINKIDHFENLTYSPSATLTGADMLKFLLKDNSLKQSDIMKEIGSQGYISDILNKKRPINIEMARSLGKRFSLKPSVFLSIV